jgi:hypothetical protein
MSNFIQAVKWMWNDHLIVRRKFWLDYYYGMWFVPGTGFVDKYSILSGVRWLSYDDYTCDDWEVCKFQDKRMVITFDKEENEVFE